MSPTSLRFLLFSSPVPPAGTPTNLFKPKNGFFFQIVSIFYPINCKKKSAIFSHSPWFGGESCFRQELFLSEIFGQKLTKTRPSQKKLFIQGSKTYVDQKTPISHSDPIFRSTRDCGFSEMQFVSKTFNIAKLNKFSVSNVLLIFKCTQQTSQK